MTTHLGELGFNTLRPPVLAHGERVQPDGCWFTSIGVGVYGCPILAVRGRSSGQWRIVPVNLLEYNGTRYLVAPRGVTQWVRNIRASGAAELRLGRRQEPIRVVEMADDDKPELLRAYLRRWRFEVGVFFQGVGPDASTAELRRIAPDHPVFRLIDTTVDEPTRA